MISVATLIISFIFSSTCLVLLISKLGGWYWTIKCNTRSPMEKDNLHVAQHWCKKACYLMVLGAPKKWGYYSSKNCLFEIHVCTYTLTFLSWNFEYWHLNYHVHLANIINSHLITLYVEHARSDTHLTLGFHCNFPYFQTSVIIPLYYFNTLCVCVCVCVCSDTC